MDSNNDSGMSYLDICRTQIPTDEGRRARAYKDSMGILSGGIGRNLEGVSFTDGEIALMFANDLERADFAARTLFPSFGTLSENRKAAIVNMAFNLGQERLSEFHHMRDAVTAEDFDAAADAMADSLWAKQVGARALRLEKMIREG